jgi:hypothetical protein
MVDLTSDDVDLTRPTQALFAVTGHVDTNGSDGFKKRLIHWYLHGQLTVLQLNLEGYLVVRIELGPTAEKCSTCKRSGCSCMI